MLLALTVMQLYSSGNTDISDDTDTIFENAVLYVAFAAVLALHGSLSGTAMLAGDVNRHGQVEETTLELIEYTSRVKVSDMESE